MIVKYAKKPDIKTIPNLIRMIREIDGADKFQIHLTGSLSHKMLGYDVESYGAGSSDIDIEVTGGNGVDSDAAAQTFGGVLVENNIIYDVGGFAVTANANDDDRVLGTQIGIGDATSGNFQNLDEYENTFTVTAVATTDFVDYANQDYRIRRDSALYKLNNGLNLGALQNEDFEFASVS